MEVMIDGLVICDVKIKDESNPLWKAQIDCFLKLTGKSFIFLINFKVV